ncbi:hypothetical protein [Pseudomonas sp. TWP3-1]|uniref:hypothetical protein n=1 Tax=Pseudomonas sp. TWP3-1 TaxID=2804631 RepID=UPI003CF7487D
MTEQYSLPDVLARMYENQLAIESVFMELVLLEEQRAPSEACDNARVALEKIGEIRGISSKELLDWEEILGRRFFDPQAFSRNRRLQNKVPLNGYEYEQPKPRLQIW